jgi:hypothetical protein
VVTLVKRLLQFLGELLQLFWISCFGSLGSNFLPVPRQNSARL